MRRIRIRSGKVGATAVLDDSPTSQAIWDALPIEGRANTWGEEIYFTIPVSLELADDARDEVEVGELGYWPPGRAFCIFFGRTPASRGDEPRAASPVNVFGRVEGNVKVFKKVRDGDAIVLERAE
ncbi:MAG: hypothetical protein H5T59_00725 [Anaerolineae bacterium]|nr:hypothetical protein [Anaerolineae bacterium]